MSIYRLFILNPVFSGDVCSLAVENYATNLSISRGRLHFVSRKILLLSGNMPKFQYVTIKQTIELVCVIFARREVNSSEIFKSRVDN